LLEIGRRDIAYIGPEDKRIAGYQQALWEAGITPNRNMIYTGADAQFGYTSCGQIIAARLPLDGICAGSDEVAIGILNAIYRSGLRVPQDVAVASIDNIDISAFTIPALTTIDIPKHEIGFHAVETLIADKTQRGSSAFVITVPTQLIIRESSVAPN
jgi:LacI family transcriptional regulator